MRRLKFLLLFLWTAGLMGATLWRYATPFSDATGLLQAAACAGALLAAATALGRAALLRLEVSLNSWVQEAVFSVGLGLLCLGLLAAALAGSGLLFPSTSWLLLGLVLILQWDQLESLLQALSRNLRNKHPWEGSSTEIAILVVLALCFGSLLLLVLAPPSFYDALVYHLAQAQRAAVTGRLQPQEAVLFTWLPSLPTPLWALALSLDGAPLGQAWAPALLNLAVAVALLFGMMDVSARLLRERRLWLAPALAFAQPLLALSFGVFSPDGWSAFLAFLSLDAFLLALDDRNPKLRGRWLLLSALLAGAATACKPVALLPALVLLALGAWQSLQDPSWRRPGLLAAALGAFLLPLLPWMIQGALLRGQPLYPFPVQLGPWNLGAGASAAYFGHMQGFGGAGWQAWLRLPYAVFFDSASLGGDGHLSFLLLALAPAALAFPLERALRWTGAYLLLGAGLWCLGPHVLRYALPLLPGACLLGAQAVVQAEGWAVSVTWTWAWRALVLAGLALGAVEGLEISVMQFDPLDAALGVESPTQSLERHGVPQMAATQWILAHGGGPASAVLLLGDARSAWLPAGTLAASVFETHPFVAWAAACPDPQRVAALLRRKGYDFVIFNAAEWRRLRQGPGPAPAYWAPGDAAGQAKFEAFVDWLRALPAQDRFEQGGCLVAHLH